MKIVNDIIHYCSDKKSHDLQLYSKGLFEIPESIYELTHITNLDLQKNNIKTISSKIIQLQNLEELWLSNNLIEEIPIEISQLPNLRRLHLSNNLLTNFPEEFLKNEKLSHLCIRGNLLESLPEDIENISIRDVSFNNNKISSIPITYDNADFYKSIGLGGNPLENPPSGLFNSSLSVLLKYLLEKDRGRKFVIPFSDELKTTFKQYLIYFGDFVKNTKGISIGFEIINVEEGLEIEVKTENNTDEEIVEIEKYMQEYVAFIKTKVDDIKPLFEMELDANKRNFVVVELKSQIRNLQTQLDIKVAANESLKEDRERYYQLLNNFGSSKQKIIINTNSSSENTLIQNTQILTQISSSLPNFIDELTEFRKHISSEDFVAKELSDIDLELLRMDDCGEVDSTGMKTQFKKLKRVLEDINNEESSLNQIVNGSQKAIVAAQKLASAYNDFAEWLGLPQVPKVFLQNK